MDILWETQAFILSYTKIDPKWVTDIKTKHKTSKTMYKRKKSLKALNIQIFLSHKKVYSIKQRIDKLNFIKIKTFSSKYTIK